MIVRVLSGEAAAFRRRPWLRFWIGPWTRVLALGVVLATLMAASLTTVALGAPAAVIKKIEVLNGKAIQAYEEADTEKAKSLLLDAVVLGKMNGLGEKPALARTYLNLGLVHVDGLKDEEKGARYFSLALRVDPKINLKPGLASPAVDRVFAAARVEAKAASERDEQESDSAEAAATGTAEASAADGKRAEAESAKRAEADAKRAEAELEAAKRAEADRVITERANAAREQAEASRRRLADEKASKQREREARDERDKILTDLADAREREAKEQAARDKEEREQLRRDAVAASQRHKSDLATLADRHKNDLAQAAARSKAQDADKARLEREKAQLIAEKAALGNEKAALQKKVADLERAAKEAADRAVALDKSNAGEKQKLLVEKAAVEKRLGEAEGREKNERAAKDKLIEEQRLAVLRAKKEKEEAAAEAKRLVEERERLAAGPDLPAQVREKVHCTTPDTHPPGVDVFVHCMTQAQVKSDELNLFYRPSGQPRYNSVAMERNKKGWFTAAIPAAVIKGSMLQYYVEADGGRGRALASNGKAGSPNVITVNRWPAPVADGSAAGGRLQRANARRR